MNNVNLIGRFAKDPDLRYSASGTAICNFVIAVRNPYKDDDGADFISCVAWQRVAELVAENHEKGNMIGVTGRLQTRSYEDNEGIMRYVSEVNVESIHFIQTITKEDEDNKSRSSAKNRNGKSNSRNRK